MWRNFIFLIIFIGLVYLKNKYRFIWVLLKSFIKSILKYIDRLSKHYHFDSNFYANLNKQLRNKDQLFILIDKSLHEKFNKFQNRTLDAKKISHEFYYLKFKIYKYKFIIFVKNKNTIYSTKFEYKGRIKYLDIINFTYYDRCLNNFDISNITIELNKIINKCKDKKESYINFFVLFLNTYSNIYLKKNQLLSLLKFIYTKSSI